MYLLEQANSIGLSWWRNWNTRYTNPKISDFGIDDDLFIKLKDKFN